ncbi:MAG TPA: hypothetical protein PKE45_03635 [Caldilineaceae bacterium]|nr:hypothetical protein [Caldilineaceae bacterium]
MPSSRKQRVKPALPSRDEIAAFAAAATGKIGKREIARAFAVAPEDRAALKDMLRDLEDEGTLDELLVRSAEMQRLWQGEVRE